MSAKKDGLMIILSSPSGAGKTTIVKKLSNKLGFDISVSYTTRIPRINEENGKDYYFIKKKDFEKLIENNELLEYAKVFDNFYGTSKLKVTDQLDKGKNILFDIDWQGTRQIKEKKLNYNLLTIFILPPSRKTLLGRLLEREKNNMEVVDSRMRNFENDVKHWPEYDYVVINDELEICFNDILNIINRKFNDENIGYDKSKIDFHIKKLLS